MSITATVKARDDFSSPDVEALQRLKEAVYPPDENETWDGASREWTTPQWGVFVRDDSGELVSYTGVIRRDGSVDGHPATIGGVGGVATHPGQRGRGYAALGIGRALDYLATRGTDFALLVCRDELVPYYEGLGWRVFTGTVLVRQFGAEETFVYNRVMVGDLNLPAPTQGTIDLKGPPW